MGLIMSPRLTERDIRHWRKLERSEDARMARTQDLERRELRAVDELQRFASTGGPCFVGVSWGKDSTVLAHLAARAEIDVPFVCVRYVPAWNPDCESVRDAFLARFPSVAYDEIQTDDAYYDSLVPAGKGWDDLTRAQINEMCYRVANERYGRHILGLRAEESGVRKLRARGHGVSTRNTCAPLSWWRAEHIFGHLYKHDLPVHPAYAMSDGGIYERGKLRVDFIGGERGVNHGRREWERLYYGDILAKLGRE